MERIVIVGTTGSGKTTLARQIADIDNRPFIDMDELFWEPGWIEADRTLFRDRVAKAAAIPRWVMAGNFSSARDISWNAADTIIWLDYGFFRILAQLAGRTRNRITTRTPVYNGNIETWRKTFSRDSLFLWLVRSYPRNKKRYKAAFANQQDFPHIKHFIRLRRPQDTAHFLAQFCNGLDVA